MSTPDHATGRFQRDILAVIEEYERATAEGRATREAAHLLATCPERVLDGGTLRCPYEDCPWEKPDAVRPRLWLAAHLADQHPEE